ncbi:hypothetical protein MMYC01_201943 [Madurella mycetomatis]|uniref:2EXR domain-containing protein n=1 Tax=Madurella mycetomatis TaxID=100816 RepID=A0A175WCB4_9PEZI|nr:hypothetical protein MMYC01_201943 [Madurella mycetomatis]
MAASRRPQIINPSHSSGGANVLFRAFPKLPTELRLCIWEFSLERHRLLELNVEPRHDSEKAPSYSSKNALGKLLSGRSYSVTVRSFPIYNKLLRVNREARRAALGFYRVHIQCSFQTPDEKRWGKSGTISATLYCNPEYDFLQLSTCRTVEYTLADFLHDFKANDPRHVGVVHLALDVNAMNHLRSMAHIPSGPVKAGFVNTLSQLQQIIWVAHSHAGRRIVGPLQDFRGVGVRFNHSMPVKAAIPSFDLLGRDPRPIGPELRYVLTATRDPRHMRLWWRELLARWNIRQARPTKERVLFAYEPTRSEKEVRDIKSAVGFLDGEEEGWLSLQKSWHKVLMKQTKQALVEWSEELAKAVRPAIGFWLFPAEALGDLDGDIPSSKVRYDMSGYWPELALSCLS